MKAFCLAVGEDVLLLKNKPNVSVTSRPKGVKEKRRLQLIIPPAALCNGVVYEIIRPLPL